MIERCVVVQRQSDGYGLTVSGDHPVFVHTVSSDGPAFCAGVRQGDRIVKVNGMPVTTQNHLDVVRMISSGQTLALTLLGKAPDPGSIGSYSEHKTEYTKPAAPEPMPTLEKEEWKRRRKEMIAQMLEEERRHVEELRESAENGEKLEKSIRRIQKLQTQLRGATPPRPPSLGALTNTSSNLWLQGGRRASDGLISDSENDEDMLSNEATGPFSNIVELKGHPAHLAVFISYLLSNASPNSLFFYLITDAYQLTSASAKELRRWAFEIFTTFIVPNSPMAVPNMDQNIIQPIERAISSTASDVRDADADILRKVFIPARQRAEADIRDHLADFRLKRNIGNLFDAAQLGEAADDSSLEWRLGESLLLRALESTVRAANPDYDLCSATSQALLSSLATLIKVVLCLKPNVPHWERLLEKCPTFVTKDKAAKLKTKLPLKKSVQVKGHQFTLNPVNVVHYCYQCRDVIWAMQPYAYFCTNCDVVIHKHCAISLADACYPATKGKSKENKENKLKRPKSREGNDEDRVRRDGSLPRDISIQKLTPSDSGIGAEMMHEKIVGRSQSMRGRTTSESSSEAGKRGKSALSWGTDLTPAEEEAEIIKSHVVPRGVLPSEHRTNDSVSRSSGFSYPDEDTKKMYERLQGDPDLDMDMELPELQSLVSAEVYRHLKPKERSRQEVINELFNTERTHVRNLKIMYNLFYLPIVQGNLLAPDVVSLLFSNLEEVLQLHKELNDDMKAAVEHWTQEPNSVGFYGDVGELLLRHFEGEKFEKFQAATAEFCKDQQHALEILRTLYPRYKKDKYDPLNQLFVTAESHPLCKKQQFKDMLIVEMQRVTRYPLLLSRICSHSEEGSEEMTNIAKATENIQKAIFGINQAKKNTEDFRKLQDFQQRLDTSPFDKESNGYDFASLDLTKHQLIHEGTLMFRSNNRKLVETHAILLEHMLVLLTKRSDGHGLMLKFLEPSKDCKWSPLLPLHSLAAVDKPQENRAIVLFYNSTAGAQIYELVAQPTELRKSWLQKLTKQIDYAKKAHEQGLGPVFNLNAGGPIGRSAGSDDGQMTKVNVMTHPRLVSAKEVRVEQPTILEQAKPILTPIERLRRADQQIFEGLAEKQAILAQFLPGDKNGRKEELDKLTEMLSGVSVMELKNLDANALFMASIVHGNRLLDAINQGMMAQKIGEDAHGAPVMELTSAERNLPSVPCYKLTAIVAPLLNTIRAQMAQSQEKAEQHAHGLSVSEETLTEVSSLQTEPPERKLVTRRLLPTNIPPQPPPPTSLPPPV
ncbi:unnamed protein product, partial [Mesorhabditis spiculigera]